MVCLGLEPGRPNGTNPLSNSGTPSLFTIQINQNEEIDVLSRDSSMIQKDGVFEFRFALLSKSVIYRQGKLAKLKNF